jgi:hypothetical protein
MRTKFNNLYYVNLKNEKNMANLHIDCHKSQR